VQGTEHIPELLTQARAAGFEVSGTPELIGAPQNRGSFDLVVAFDLIEHLEQGELPGFFAAVHALLKPGGAFLTRFPNGHSPFGRLYQYGDLTHKSVIGAGTIEHLAAVTGFEIVEMRNPRMAFVANPLLWVPQVLQRGLRNLTEMTLGYIYFNRRLPLDPNLVAHLQKPGAAA